MEELLNKFKDQKVLIFGDVMLDQYLIGDAERISPEAPVPVVKLLENKFIPGGAANVAANVAGLGGEPILVGVIGDKDDGMDVFDALRKKNVSGDYLFLSRERPTTIKTRVIANKQQIARVDRETSAELSRFEEEKVWEIFETLIINSDILIISDYGKGTVSENICPRLITKANKLNIKILIDPKGNNYNKYKAASLMTPNKNESINALDSLSRNFEKDFNLIELVKELKIEAILVTEGQKGMTLYEKNKNYKLEAKARKVFDVTGAGDTVIAVMALAVAAGADYFTAAYISNIAAGLVVEEVGTSVVDFENLSKYLRNESINN
ncbi:MAG: D-glycero-beta-D-manno-heptose-7-phosphate kinase [Acidobacteriota bacterium]|nr:D-glycero-beta-D-manno-heptose-7-phosphate kinase [Acidobacteriota bacterium]